MYSLRSYVVWHLWSSCWASTFILVDVSTGWQFGTWKQKFRFSKRPMNKKATFVLMSTGSMTQLEWSPCTLDWRISWLTFGFTPFLYLLLGIFLLFPWNPCRSCHVCWHFFKLLCPCAKNSDPRTLLPYFLSLSLRGRIGKRTTLKAAAAPHI